MAASQLPKSLRDQIQRLLTQLNEAPNATMEDCSRWLQDGRDIIRLTSDHVAACDKVIRAIRAYVAPNGEWSESAILSQLDDKLRILRHGGQASSRESVAEECHQIFELLQSAPVEWDVYFRVAGIYEDCLPMTIGNVTFFPATESLANRVVRRDGEPSPNLPANLVDLIRPHSRQELEEEFGGNPWVMVRVTAAPCDQEAARYLAHEHLRLTLDVMNFYADVWRPKSYRARVSFGYEPTPGPLSTLALVGNDEASGLATRVMGPFDKVWLPPLDSGDAQELGLDRVSEILAKSPASMTEVERRVVAALRWAGRATVAQRADEALLLYLIALEGLVMGPQKSDAVLYKLSHRVAHLFDDIDVRKEIADALKQVYDLRSRLVHTGTSRIEPSDVQRARFLTKESIVKVLCKSAFAAMTKDSELDDWFELRLLGGDETTRRA